MRTVIVHDTFRFTTNLVGVAEVARRADTPGLMGSNLTYSFYTALLIIARVLAFPLYTCLGEGAFKVTLATRFYTCSIGIPFKGRWTDTHGPVVVNAANCGGSALFKGARITAFLSNACKVQRTLWIRYTFRFGWFSDGRADLVCIPFISRRTDTVSPVILYFTDSVDAALVVVHAGVFAFLGDTGQQEGTVAVDGTLRLALRVRISLETCWAGTLAVVSDRSGDSVDSTRIRVARIHHHRVNGWRADALNQGIPGVSW